MMKPTLTPAPSGADLLFWTRDQLLEHWASHHDLRRLAFGCRLNALSAIQAAGSGHIGTSFSAMDIMLTARRFLAGDSFLTENHSEKGIFFSSKGHDAPAFYAVMHLCGELEDKDLLTLRRLGGLPGHPETITPGVPTNTGSLGMGISKAKGFIKAKRLANPDSRDPVIVMLGDGELNEGQIWESMPGATRDGFDELIAIVDANSIQSDTWSEKTLPMGDLRMRVEAVDWHYQEIDGHQPDDILAAMDKALRDPRPSFIVANTTKGAGVSWMERFDEEGDYYKFHSGGIAPDLYEDAVLQLVAPFEGLDYEPVATLDPHRNEFDGQNPRPRPSSMLVLWEQLLPELMQKHRDIVIMDGDLSYDTGTHLARKQFPDRYIQAGIAEQDMVSMAGTMALSGLTPIVHSFSTFLTMRAAEQIFNNATEYSRVLYFGFLAGLVPSAPGFSHQAVSDVGLMSSVPRMHVIEPACVGELASGMAWALAQGDPVYFRMGNTTPIDKVSEVSKPGDLVRRRAGERIAVVSSGPLLTEQALLAADHITSQTGEQIAVYTMPWITSPLSDRAIKELAAFRDIYVVENHNPARAKHLHLSDGRPLSPQTRVHRVGLDGIPQNGQPGEVLEHHGLDVKNLAAKFVSGE